MFFGQPAPSYKRSNTIHNHILVNNFMKPSISFCPNMKYYIFLRHSSNFFLINSYLVFDFCPQTNLSKKHLSEPELQLSSKSVLLDLVGQDQSSLLEWCRNLCMSRCCRITDPSRIIKFQYWYSKEPSIMPLDVFLWERRTEMRGKILLN